MVKIFYERINNLCKENKTNMTNVLKELGLSTSKGTAWKNGTIPNGEIIYKLAVYFDVSTDYILGRTDDPVNSMDIIGRIFDLMTQRGITAAQLTREVPLTNGVVTQWKQKKQNPSLDAVVKIANYFGVTTDYLLTGKEHNLHYVENKRGESEVRKRYINFETVKEGLLAYFDNRYTYIDPDKGAVIRRNELKELSCDTGISWERLTIFFFIAYELDNKRHANKNDYPTSVEFDKMMLISYCDDKSAVLLQKELNDEFNIFLKEQQMATYEQKNSPLNDGGGSKFLDAIQGKLPESGKN